MKILASILHILFILQFITPEKLYAGVTCKKYGILELSNGEYNVQNNVWGADTRQCIATLGSAGFYVKLSQHTLGPGTTPASYPFIWKGCHWDKCTRSSNMPIRVKEIRSTNLQWRFEVNKHGVWSAIAEAWFKKSYSPGAPDATELMLWLDSNGIAPAGSMIDVIKIDGIIWEVWTKDIGWTLVTYRRRKAAHEITIDLLPFIQDSIRRGFVNREWFMMNAEAGFELWRGGAGFKSSFFSFDIKR